MTSHRATRWILLWAFAAALVLAGCGGSSNSESAATTTTAATTSSGAGGKSTRLTQAQWAEYKTTAAKAKTVNDAAIKTFAKCRKLSVSAQDPDKVKACLGDSTSTVVTVGKQTLTELDKLTSGTTGNCAKASEQLTGYVKVYVASVQAIGTSVDQHTTPSTATIDNASTGLKHARAANTAFVAACKPTGTM